MFKIIKCKCGTKQSGSRKIDKCMVKILKALRHDGYNTVACCCGHGKYKPTVVIKGLIIVAMVVNPVKLIIYEQVFISRKRRFYKKDNEGDYYIPEVEGIT